MPTSVAVLILAIFVGMVVAIFWGLPTLQSSTSPCLEWGWRDYWYVFGYCVSSVSFLMYTTLVIFVGTTVVALVASPYVKSVQSEVEAEE